jgi:hypothetical protein
MASTCDETAMSLSPTDITAIADGIVVDLAGQPSRTVPSRRTLRRRVSARLQTATGGEIIAVATLLIGRAPRWFACEIVGESRPALDALDIAAVEALGAGMASWDEVDGFAVPVSGAAWLRGQVSDDDIRRWASSPDPWWRRAALVSTVTLNSKSRGGRGDTTRTLEIAAALVDDREDMVVKAMSWALRTLVPWDAAAVRRFVADHDGRVAARVVRETRTKLETGRKNRKPSQLASS